MWRVRHARCAARARACVRAREQWCVGMCAALPPRLRWRLRVAAVEGAGGRWQPAVWPWARHGYIGVRLRPTTHMSRARCRVCAVVGMRLWAAVGYVYRAFVQTMFVGGGGGGEAGARSYGQLCSAREGAWEWAQNTKVSFCCVVTCCSGAFLLVRGGQHVPQRGVHTLATRVYTLATHMYTVAHVCTCAHTYA